MRRLGSTRRIHMMTIFLAALLWLPGCIQHEGTTESVVYEEPETEALLQPAAAAELTETSLGAVLATASSTRPSRTTAKPTLDISELSVSGIGDSLLVGSGHWLDRALDDITYRAENGIQMYKGIQFLEELSDEEVLGSDALIVCLGTNGAITEGQVERILELAPTQRIIAVNIYIDPELDLDWVEQVNNVWAKAARRKRRIEIVDWHGYVEAHPDVMSGDGVHPSEEGFEAYADLILEQLSQPG